MDYEILDEYNYYLMIEKLFHKLAVERYGKVKGPQLKKGFQKTKRPGTQLNDKLRNKRHRRKMTQQELAEELGVSQTYLSLMERGERKLPKYIKKWMK